LGGLKNDENKIDIARRKGCPGHSHKEYRAEAPDIPKANGSVSCNEAKKKNRVRINTTCKRKGLQPWLIPYNFGYDHHKKIRDLPWPTIL